MLQYDGSGRRIAPDDCTKNQQFPWSEFLISETELQKNNLTPESEFTDVVCIKVFLRYSEGITSQKEFSMQLPF